MLQKQRKCSQKPNVKPHLKLSDFFLAAGKLLIERNVFEVLVISLVTSY